MVGGSTGALTAPSVIRLVFGRDGQSYIRRTHIAFISLAFATIAVNLVDIGASGSVAPGQLTLWVLPAVAAAVVAGATLVIVSGSPASLEALGELGLPEVSAQRRANANGMVWAGIGLLMVHFTAPAYAVLPGGALIVGLVVALGLGIGAMRLHLTAVDHEAYRSFNLVAMLLAAGSLAAMSITPTGDWWEHNFSTLGTSGDFAAACFNVAVSMSGLGMALLGPALTGALRSERFRLRRGGLLTIRVLIAFIGVSLMGVGVVPIDGATDLHNLFACCAAAGFAVLALGVQLWARRMPRALVISSYGALAVEIAALIAYDGLKVFNLTVFEVVAFTLVFAWLIALVAITAETRGDESAVEVVRVPVGVEVPRHRVRPRGRVRPIGGRTVAGRTHPVPAGRAGGSRPGTLGPARRRRRLASVPDKPPDRSCPPRRRAVTAVHARERHTVES
jgi:hypothetical protein